MAMLQDLDRLSVDAKGTIHVSDPPEKALPSLLPLVEPSRPLIRRSFKSKIDRSWRIASFSSLISGLPAAADWADRDDDNIPDPVSAVEKRGTEKFLEGGDLFSFPTGIRTGIFFHDLLEHFDFTEKNPAVTGDLVASKLREHSLDIAWCDAIIRAMDRVVSVTLKMGKEEFSLSQISPQQRLNELAFYYPIKRASPQKMLKLMSPWEAGLHKGRIPETLGRVTFSPFKGFMKGYIDLIFEHGSRYYLVDWKSNYLGNHTEDYGPEALARAMGKGQYVLQCHIYALALHQYLKHRVPGFHYDTHYGGIFYVFLRGLNPERGHVSGIYRDRPPEEQLKTWVTDLIP
jgi:exodeoxyribonuclease V beta subunit